MPITISNSYLDIPMLQVYREVFEYLINDFKTYQQLLAAIKQEYELVLKNQEERLKELDPLKVWIVS